MLHMLCVCAQCMLLCLLGQLFGLILEVVIRIDTQICHSERYSQLLSGLALTVVIRNYTDTRYSHWYSLLLYRLVLTVVGLVLTIVSRIGMHTHY